MPLTREKKDKLRKRYKTISAILKLLLLLFILVGLPLYIYFFRHDIIEQFSTIEQIEAFFAEYKTQSIIYYLALQIIQIIICVIPGQGLQFAAGYMYGFWMGYVWSLIGAFLGTVISYYLAKVLGHDAMHMAKLAPTTMIFIPCKEGISHNPAEFAKLEDICRAVNVLAKLIEAEANE